MDAHKKIDPVIKTVVVGILVCSLNLLLSCSKNIETRERTNLTDWCSGTGRITGINGDMCPEENTEINHSWNIKHEMSLNPYPDDNYFKNVLLPINNCKIDAMKIYRTDKIKLRVEKYLGEHSGNNPNDVVSHYQVTNLSSDEQCGLILTFDMQEMRVLLAPGMIVYAAKDQTMIMDLDQWSTKTLRSENGNLLYAECAQISPDVWSKSLLPELSLKTEDEICKLRNNATGSNYLFKFSLIDKDQVKCTLDAVTYRCCTLGGVDYKVLSNIAYRRIIGPRIEELVTFMIARPEVLEVVKTSH